MSMSDLIISACDTGYTVGLRYTSEVHAFSELSEVFRFVRAHFGEALEAHADEINVLHAAECELDCPWNRETIL